MFSKKKKRSSLQFAVAFRYFSPNPATPSLKSPAIDCGNKTLCLINAYLPYYCSANVDGYLQYLSDLRLFCNEVSCPNICVMGDFNASDSNGFCTYLNRFCKENGFILSDKQWLPSSTFTYISEAHGSVSLLDHCLI